MPLKYLSLNDQLYEYACAQRSNAQDPILATLHHENERLGEQAKCQISAEEGSLLTLLVKIIGAQSALEIGTFTGYSSICIARGLPAGGRLICVDQNREWTDMARRFWAKAGVESKIELRLGEALPLLRQFDANLSFDFAFIDAAKDQYDDYYELVLPHVRQNGLIVFDNMLWAGRLSSGPAADDRLGQAIDALNRKLAQDVRVETVLLPIADGIQLCRKR
jgi:caffeoyl-CoA O-methyltransferase